MCKHIAANKPLPGACEAVGVDEAADVGVVVTALQVIESRLLVRGVAVAARYIRSTVPSRKYCVLVLFCCVDVVLKIQTSKMHLHYLENLTNGIVLFALPTNRSQQQ